MGTSPHGHDIAVVGMAGRFPGAGDVDAFWRLLREGRDGVVRLDIAALAGHTGAFAACPDHVAVAAELDGIENFDAAFFRLGARDAALMDPQHRHLLEVAWSALEHAGYDPVRVPGPVGVFAGCGASAYLPGHLLVNSALMAQLGLFYVRHAGNDKDFLATRISYALDLKGPSVSVQTGGSTSLAAVHVAIQSLIAGECDLALAGGVTIDLPHGQGYLAGADGTLSRQGRCRPFDDRADGTVPASGAGVVVLRRLEDAVRDGDTVHAMLLASVVGHLGEAGVDRVASERRAQLIREVLARAGAAADSISFVAAGTGVRTADASEMTALAATLGASDPDSGWRLGSIAGAVGHLDAAAGVASLIAVTQALRHRELIPTRHFETLNALADPLPRLVVTTAGGPWTSPSGARRALVSAPADGGSGALVVVEEAPPLPPPAPSRRWQLLAWSGRTVAAAERLTDALATALEGVDPAGLPDVAYTLTLGRRAFEERRIAVVESPADARRILRQRHAPALSAGRPAASPPGVAFAFPGGGAQYPDMARGLVEHEPVFAETFASCLEELEALGVEYLEGALFPAADRLDGAADELRSHATLALPAIFSVSYALARTLQAWGIRPTALIGHSLGEYVAACLAGVWSLPDALSIVVTRGRLFDALPPGAMLSIAAPAAALASHLDTAVSIAAVNSPVNTVVAGSDAAIGALETRLTAAGLEHRRLPITVAAHSRELDPILPTFRRALRTIRFSPPTLPCISNVTGRWLTAADAVDPEYWVRHLRSTVRFADGLSTLLAEPRAFVELGPGSQLASLVRQHAAVFSAPLVLNTLRHAKERDDDQRTLLHAVGRLWTVGVPVDWAAVYEGEARRRVPLPTYPFARDRHWVDPRHGVVHNEDGAPGLVRPKDPDQWLGHARWLRQDLSVASGVAGPTTWLVFAGAHPLGPRLAQTLRDEGRRVVVVRHGAAYGATGPDEVVVRPGESDDYTALLAALGSHATPLGVVHAWPLDPPADVGTRACFAAAQAVGFTSGLRLLQALQRSTLGEDARVWFLATGFESVHDETVTRPDAATLRGLALVAPVEWPSLQTGTLDIGHPPAAVDPDLVRAVTSELAAGRPAPRVALRDATRFVHEVEMAPPPDGPAAPIALRAGGTYVITGGLGGLGLAHARFLARRYQARLVLVSRQAGVSRSEAVDELEGLGAEVLVASADVTDAPAMRQVVLAARRRFGRIDGVFHAAGVLEPTLLAQLDPADADRAMAAKTHGVFVLDEVFADDPPDLIVSFSSISALVGIAGQTAYAAASSFLNAWAHTPAPAGQRRVTVNYGPWREAGMTARPGVGDGSGDSPDSDRRDHPLLGRRRAAASGGEVFETTYRASALWVLAEHAVPGGPAVLPGAAAFEMIAAALGAAGGSRERPPCTIDNLQFVEPLAIARDGAVAVRVSLVPTGRDLRYAVESRPAGLGWREHVAATVSPAAGPAPRVDLTAIRARCREDRGVDSTAPHRHQAQAMDFGARWQAMLHVGYGVDEVLASIDAPPAAAADGGYAWHPAVVDLALTAGLALAPSSPPASGPHVWVPSACDRATLWLAPGRRVLAHARFRRADSPERVAVFDVTLLDDSGAVLAEFTGWRLRGVAASRLTGTVPPGRPAAARDPVSVLADEHGIGDVEGTAALVHALSYPARKLIVSSLDVTALRAHLATLTSGAGRPAGRARRSHDMGTPFAPPRTDLERQLVDAWARHLGLDQVGIHDNFFELGGESLVGLRLFAEIRRTFGVALPVDTLFAAPTIAALADALLARAPAASGPGQAPATATGALDAGTAVVIQAGNGTQRPRLFCVHDQNGYVLLYRDLARLLGPDQPFVALQAAGLDDPRLVDRTVEAMATRHLLAVRQLQPVGPYWLAGSSLGGIVAFEMARQLTAAGEEVALLALLDSWTPANLRGWWFSGDDESVWMRARRHVRELATRGPRQYLDHRLQNRRAWQDYQRQAQAESERHEVFGAQAAAHVASGTPMPPEVLAHYLEQIYGEAYRTYDATAYSGMLTLFRAAERGHHRDVDPTLGWSDVPLGGLEVISVPGPHGLIVREPFVATLAMELRRVIDRAMAQVDGASPIDTRSTARRAGTR